MNAIAHISEHAPIADNDASPSAVDLSTRHAGHAVLGRDDLAKALAFAKLIADKRGYTPILSNVRIAAGGAGEVDITATDLDMEITVTVAAAVDPGFAMTVPAHLVNDFLRKAPASDMVAMESQGEAMRPNYKGVLQLESIGRATFDFERVRYTVDALPNGDFPALSPREFSHAFCMPGSAFRDMLAAVAGAVSTEETRYYLNGVYLHCPHAGNELIAVATDGHRLYRQTVAAPNGTLGMPGVILPRGFVALVAKLFKGKDCPEQVILGASDARFVMRFGNVRVETKLIDGTYPDYQRIIPTGNDRHATFEAGAMAEAINAVTVILSERGRAVRLSIDGGKCLLSTSNPDTGTAEMSIPCDLETTSQDAAPYVDTGFNAKYLLDMLAECDGQVKAEFADTGSPAVFRSSRDGWLAVLMPMRV